MSWLIGLGVCLALAVVVAAYIRLTRLSRDVASLKEAARVELGTVQIGNARALEERLADLSERETFPILAGRIALHSPSSTERIRALAALRAVAVRGADEIFADGDGFWLLMGGRADPFRVGGYFLGELRAYKIQAACSWAYTGSADPSVRREVRAAALQGVERARTNDGLSVKVLGPEAWQDVGAGDGRIADASFRERRENTGLRRLEFASLVGATLDQVICWETGRECEVALSDQLSMKLGLLEKAISSVVEAGKRAEP